MPEESTYFARCGCAGSTTRDGEHRPAFFGQLPWPAYPLVPALVRRKMGATLIGQGTAATADEICQRALADLSALEAMLASSRSSPASSQGDRCHHLRLIANLPWAPIDNPVRAEGLKRPALVAHAERMQARVGR